MAGLFADFLTIEFGAAGAANLLRASADPAALRALLAPLPTRSRIVRCLLLSRPATEDESATTPPVIPRKLVQFWHEASPTGEIAELTAGWRTGNPGFAYALFSDQTARDFVQTHFPGDPLRAFDYCRNPVLRGDLFRYLYLLREGGLCVEAEQACLRPVDPALGGPAAIRLAPSAWMFLDNREIAVRRALESKLDGTTCGFYLANAPLASGPGHRLLRAATDRALQAILQARARGTPARVADATAPPVFTEAVLASLLGAAADGGRTTDLGLLWDWTGNYAAAAKPSHKGGAASWVREHVPPEPRRPPADADPTPPSAPDAPPVPQAAPSPLAVTQSIIEYRGFVERFIALNGIRSIVEIGCGEWPFVRFANLPGIRYAGFDSAEAIVQRNRTAFAPRREVSFEIMPNDYADLPKADLLLAKDLLPHLPNAEILRMQAELLPRFGLALITNSWKRPNGGVNTEVEAGRVRALDLKLDPYGFPGAYVFESWGEWERIRTLLVCHDPEQPE